MSMPLVSDGGKLKQFKNENSADFLRPINVSKCWREMCVQSERKRDAFSLKPANSFQIHCFFVFN